MTGIFYGVGIGPGDPELMTLKAIRCIRENEIIALPGEKAKETTAYRIAVSAVPELEEKTLLSLAMPMVRNRALMDQEHQKAAQQVISYLEQGQNVVFLTLGDPSVYSTYSYVQHYVLANGYKTEMISGVPSFCAAAARANVPLTLWDEPLHILPASHYLNFSYEADGNFVLMKSASRMPQVKQALRESQKDVVMVENCGFPNEAVYPNVDAIPDNAAYFSLIIAK